MHRRIVTRNGNLPLTREEENRWIREEDAAASRRSQQEEDARRSRYLAGDRSFADGFNGGTWDDD